MIKQMTNIKSTRFTVVGAILLLLVIIAVWFIPRAVGDLFIALAAGRDVLSGSLTAPDTWSFATAGKVWLNQNWGADLILYLVQKISGDAGLLAFKMILLLLTAFFLVLALKKLKIPLGISLAVTAAVLVSMNIYLVLRPNLFTIAFLALELWLLYTTQERPQLIWLLVPVITAWANIHAGFIFGLGVLSLWTICILISEAIKNKSAVLQKQWPLLSSMILSFLFAGFANPFGFTNLTFPFFMTNGGAWNIMKDWLPVWQLGMLSSSLSGIISFLVVVCFTLALLVLPLFYKRTAKPKSKTKKSRNAPDIPIEDNSDLPVMIFDAILAAIAVLMALLSNRFIAIALVSLAPLFSRQFLRATDVMKRKWLLPALLNCAVLIFAVAIGLDDIRNYNPDNPVRNTGTGTLFEKMHYTNFTYDPALIRFINSNHIAGNVISPWQWEGYLHWVAPQLKVLIGGRAQQVYSEDLFSQFQYICGGDVKQYHGRSPRDILNSINAQFIITGVFGDNSGLLQTALNSGNWVIVFASESSLLLANTRDSLSNEIVAKAAVDGLSYADSKTGSMSRAAFVLSQPELWKIKDVVNLSGEALKESPAWLWGYRLLPYYLQRDEALFKQAVRLLDNQLKVLDTLELSGSNALSILQSRIFVSYMLYGIYNKVDKGYAAAKYKSYSSANSDSSKILNDWKPIAIN